MRIDVGRFNAILGRLLTMAGNENPAGDLSPEISGVLGLEMDRPEWKFLAGEQMCGVRIAVAASVANPSMCRIHNPTGSGVIAIVEHVCGFSTSAAGVSDIRAAVGAVPTARTVAAGFGVSRDTRFGQIGSMCVVSVDNAAIAGSTFDGGSVLPSTVFHLGNMPVVLGPGTHMDFGIVDTNVQLTTILGWRERPAQPFEITAR